MVVGSQDPQPETEPGRRSDRIVAMHTQWLRWCAAAAAALMLASPLSAQAPAEWSRPTEPFRIVGNVYWVGTYDLSSYLITSPEGHIVINTGLPDSVAQIRANIEQLGFRIADVKILTATHAHWDHVAGLAALKKLTGASVYMSAPDADVLESGGKTDFRWGKDSHVVVRSGRRRPPAQGRRDDHAGRERADDAPPSPGTRRARRASRSPCATGARTTAWASSTWGASTPASR